MIQTYANEVLSTTAVMLSINQSADQGLPLSSEFKKVATSSRRNFFKPGKVFRTPWVEPADASQDFGIDPGFTRGRYNELLFEKIKWFIVFNSLPGHCHCVRITTHNFRATTKSGINPSHYCVLVPREVPPKLLEGENVPNPPIHIKLSEHIQDIATEARIDLGRIYTVEYNVKVDSVGTIVPDDLKIMKSLVNKIALKNDADKLNDDGIPIQDLLEPLHTSIASLWDIQSLQRSQDLMEWLSPTNFPLQQRDILSQRTDGTAEWLQDTDVWKDWMTGTNETLFCYGMPGAGKTMLAAVAIDYLRTITSDDDVEIACLFCSHKAQSYQSVPELISALVKQLVQNNPNCRDLTMGAYYSHLTQRSRPSLDELTQTLRSICAGYSGVYLVIDALDECSPSNDRDLWRHLISILYDLQASEDVPNVQLLFTSRNVPEIVKKFENTYNVEVRAVRGDVGCFVGNRMPKLPKCIQGSEEFKNEIQARIIAVVNGMFLLARVLVDSFLDQTTLKKARAKLLKLEREPVILETVYQDTIDRIDGQLFGNKIFARRALFWITYAQRPLTIEELCHALAIEQGNAVLDHENINSWEDIISVCLGLVVVHQKSGVFQLIHNTAKEYLKLVQQDWSPYAQEEIALACLAYLSFSTFKSGSCPSDETFERRLAENQFLKYSAKYWSDHVRPVESSMSVSKFALEFLYDNTLVDSTIQAALATEYQISGYSRLFPSRTSGLHLTARYGLPYLTQRLLASESKTRRIEVDSEDGEHRTPLSYAVEGGHEQVVKLLLDNGANANARGGWYGHALQAASVCGHEEIAQMLLERGAEVNVQGGWYGHALQAASECSHKEIVRLLLARGANVNAQGGWYGNALQAAIECGNDDITELLLASGADTNRRGGRYINALQADSKSRYEEIAQAPFNNSNNRDTRNWWSGNGLQALSEHQRKELVKLILNSGATIGYTLGGWYGKVLQPAAARGWEEVTKLLLNNYASANTRSGQYVDAFGLLGSQLCNYADQGKLEEAEVMYVCAVRAYKDILGAKNTFTLLISNNLGNLYGELGKFNEAERMYKWVLRGEEEVFGLEHASTLATIEGLVIIYSRQGRFAEAVQMCKRALEGNEYVSGRKYTSTPDKTNGLSNLHEYQDRIAQIEQAYKLALLAKKKESLGAALLDISIQSQIIKSYLRS